MAEYIDRQKLIQDINDSVRFSARNGASAEMRGAHKIVDCIYSAPTADVVEVVRCKDCKHKFDRKIFGNIMCGRTAIIKNGEPYGLIATGDNQFCSYGERKTTLPENIKQTVLDNFMKGSED